jgi:hypothetical protein
MAWLCWARLIVAVVRFERWRSSLGGAMADGIGDRPERDIAADARRFAAHVERAAARLPFSTKCLPRAMALSWILRRKRIAHMVKFAVRPVDLRGSQDDLHAWVEVAGATILGDLPGPWVETLRLGN